jgi:hypothetical protein
MSPLSARSYRFQLEEHELGSWGVNEARECLLAAGAIESKVTLDWIENHYRLIVWKLAGLIRSFPLLFKSHWKNTVVLSQLLYRYAFLGPTCTKCTNFWHSYVREYERGERSLVCKICERDWPANGFMILCVSDIIQIESKQGRYYGLDMISIDT